MPVFRSLSNAEALLLVSAALFAVVMHKKQMKNRSRTALRALILCAVIGGLLTAAAPARAFDAIEFIDSYMIAAGVSPAGSGTISYKGNPYVDQEFFDGEEITLVAEPNEDYMFVQWEAGNEIVESENPSYTFTVHGELDLTAVFEYCKDEPDPENPEPEKPETEGFKVKVDFVFLGNDGSRGVPKDVKAVTLKPVLIIESSDAVLSTSKALEVKIEPNLTGDPDREASFPNKIDDLAPGKYAVSVSGLPVTIGIEGNDEEKYSLTAKAEINEKSSEMVITVYLIFSPPAAPEPVTEPAALPEDEFGAYAISKDGTKEYLLFQTYNICMAWLGSNDLCAGHEKCYHKDGK